MKSKPVQLLLDITVLLLMALFLGITYLLKPSKSLDAYQTYFYSSPKSPDSAAIHITYFGVSTLLFDDGKTQLMVDAFFTRPTFWQTLTQKIASKPALIDSLFESSKINRLQAVFTTHTHFDHALDLGYVCAKTKAKLYGSISALRIGKGGGLEEDKLSLIKPFETIQVGGFEITAIPSKHSPNNLLRDDERPIPRPISQPLKVDEYAEGGSYDYFIKRGKKTFFVKASANFIPGQLATIQADVVFLGVALVSKQSQDWQEQYFRQTLANLKPKTVVPLHWDNFFLPLSHSLEPMPRLMDDVGYDFDFFIAKGKENGYEFKILQAGQSMELPN
jgi:L-ascorbate metabolism protein UlaG (beta-lactamase superfamily)